ncbi:hypothetical protein CHARACLAT_032530 [Characodon lateralis]|uniref:Uncharacterized protein n=1 Tax=Characodon lateralis TaxID=208331 RepID=A0ABU7F877_9TELE|nr:hypothetical protein [Characodon lateralis]
MYADLSFLSLSAITSMSSANLMMVLNGKREYSHVSYTEFYMGLGTQHCEETVLRSGRRNNESPFSQFTTICKETFELYADDVGSGGNLTTNMMGILILNVEL